MIHDSPPCFFCRQRRPRGRGRRLVGGGAWIRYRTGSVYVWYVWYVCRYQLCVMLCIRVCTSAMYSTAPRHISKYLDDIHPLFSPCIRLLSQNLQ